MPTKDQLLKQNEALRKRVEELENGKKQMIANIDKECKRILDSYCSDAIEAVEQFCDNLGLDFPSSELIVKIPYHITNTNLYDEDGNEIEVLETRIK